MFYIKKILKYIILKIKLRNKLIFPFSSEININSKFEGQNKIEKNVYFAGEMGKGTYIAKNSYIEGKVGRFCSIAQNCTTIQGTHPYTYPFVSTSPTFYSTQKQNGQSYTSKNQYNEIRYAMDKYAVVIGNDCWIGYGVSIVAGVTIGDGAMILAHAIVTKNVPPYAIIGGIPGKIIGYRFNKEDIEFLLNLKWWNKSDAWIRENAIYFNNFDKFKKHIIENLKE